LMRICTHTCPFWGTRSPYPTSAYRGAPVFCSPFTHILVQLTTVLLDPLQNIDMPTSCGVGAHLFADIDDIIPLQKRLRTWSRTAIKEDLCSSDTENGSISIALAIMAVTFTPPGVCTWHSLLHIVSREGMNPVTFLPVLVLSLEPAPLEATVCASYNCEVRSRESNVTLSLFSPRSVFCRFPGTVCNLSRRVSSTSPRRLFLPYWSIKSTRRVPPPRARIHQQYASHVCRHTHKA
jgi:hypothetical protein